jgi:hypothetical protein
MRNQLLHSQVVLGFIVTGLLAGCSHKTDAKTELEKTAEILGKANTEPATPTAPEPTAEPSTVGAALPPGSSGSSAVPAATPAQQMRQALASYKSGELEDAVTRLQNLRRLPTLTAEQRMAVQDSVAAVMAEIYELAGKGDTRAIQAVRQYEEMQTSRH